MTVVEIFKELVCKTESALQKNGIQQTINYQYGHIEDIINVLLQYKTLNIEAKKYPLIALIQPFQEQEIERKDISKEVTLRILICANSRKDATPSLRYDKNFTDVIHEIESELINQIKKSIYFENNYLEPSYTATDDWGENRELADYIDIRNITNLKLKLRKFYCKPQN